MQVGSPGRNFSWMGPRATQVRQSPWWGWRCSSDCGLRLCFLSANVPWTQQCFPMVGVAGVGVSARPSEGSAQASSRGAGFESAERAHLCHLRPSGLSLTTPTDPDDSACPTGLSTTRGSRSGFPRPRGGHDGLLTKYHRWGLQTHMRACRTSDPGLALPQPEEQQGLRYT